MAVVAPASPSLSAAVVEGLRERKKRETRERLSDTATLLFLERGFDEVTVGEVAAACGVSEKTVFNYFPTKESLLLDREEILADTLRAALSAPGSVTRALVAALSKEVTELGDADPKGQEGLHMANRFMELIDSTPSLRAAQAELMDRLIQVAAEALAARNGSDPNSPAVQITANALMGLVRLQYRSVRRHLPQQSTPQQLGKKVIADLRAAARTIDRGLADL